MPALAAAGWQFESQKCNAPQVTGPDFWMQLLKLDRMYLQELVWDQ